MTFYLQPFPIHRHMARRWIRTGNDEAMRNLPANIRDEEDAFVLTAFVPGLTADELTINILEDVVSIEGEYKQDENEYLMRELPNGKFRRSLRLPAAVNSDKVEAKITDGVLTLRLPKAESALPKKIKIAVK